MGAQTTLWVSRQAAMAKLAEYVFGGLDNRDLETAINNRLQDSLYRICVHYSDCPDDKELERL